MNNEENKGTILSKIINFIKGIFNKNELLPEGNLVKDIEFVEPEKKSLKEIMKNQTIEERLEYIDTLDIDETEKTKRKIRILEADRRRHFEKIEENFEVKRITDADYYKDIYAKVNNGEIDVTDLTTDDFSKIIKMQRLEYELISKKLKDAMDNI